MLKLYITKQQGLTVPITFGRTSMLVKFTTNPTESYSKFSTDNVNIQKALEKKKYFGTTFKLVEQEPAPAANPVEAPKPEIKEYAEVVRLAEAKAVLVEAGAKEEAIKTKKDILAAAESMGIVFPNLKK